MNKSVSIITDLDGIVIIRDLEYQFTMQMENFIYRYKYLYCLSGKNS